MEASSKSIRKRARRKAAGSPLIDINVRENLSDPRWVTANLVDIIDSGCGLVLRIPLKPGSTVVVRGKSGPADHSSADHSLAGVRWCVGTPDGTYRAGLEFLGRRSAFTIDEEQNSAINPERVDCYAVMQLSANADCNLISRAYRKLALRYHPDNTETGNHEMFLRLSTAYQILSDPVKRARYDLTARAATRPHWKTPSMGTLRGWQVALQRS